MALVSLLLHGSPSTAPTETAQVLHTLTQRHFRCAPVYTAHRGADRSTSL